MTRQAPVRTSTRAVLTGDLVGSSGLTVQSLHRARQALLDALGEIGEWSPNLLGAEPEFFRGDSWQALLTHPMYVLRCVIYLRAKLRALDTQWDTRIAVGLGRVERVDKQRTSLSSGEAFNLSGHALDDLGSGHVAVAMPPALSSYASGLVPLAQICSVMIDDWSQKQAQIACLALPPKAPTQAEIADQLGISQQSVSKTLAAAKLPSLMQAMTYCERLNWTKRIDII